MSRKLVRKAAELASALAAVGVDFDAAQAAAEHVIVLAWLSGNDPHCLLDAALADFDAWGLDCVCGLFIWADTPEGYKFWSEVARG